MGSVLASVPPTVRLAVDFRLDVNHFNIRTLEAISKLSREWLLEMQYADEYALVAHSPVPTGPLVHLYSGCQSLQHDRTVCQHHQWSPRTPPTLHVLTIDHRQLAIVPSLTYCIWPALTMKSQTGSSEQASAAFSGSFRTRNYFCTPRLPSINLPSSPAVKPGVNLKPTNPCSN